MHPYTKLFTFFAAYRHFAMYVEIDIAPWSTEVQSNVKMPPVRHQAITWNNADLVPQKHISVKTESKYNIFFIQGNVFDNVCIMSDVEFQPPCIKHLMTPNIFQEMPCQSQRQLKRRVELLTRLNVVQLVFNSGGLWQLVFQDFSNSSTYQWKGWLSLR